MKKACLLDATTRTSFWRIVGTNKVLVLLMALLFISGVDTYAQKRNVTKAKAAIAAEPYNLKGAKDAILLALEDTTTNKLANTWFIAGEVFYKIYQEQQEIVWGRKPGTADKAVMGESLKKALEYYTKADSLDNLPDKKGRIKPKFSEKIVERTLKVRPVFPDVGADFHKQSQFMKAVDMFDLYINYSKIPYLRKRGLGLEHDTLINTLKYYSGISAVKAQRYDLVSKYFEDIKDSIKDEDERAYVYLSLSDSYRRLNDSVNLLRIYQLGARNFPKDKFYSTNLINHYINRNAMGDALKWINASLEQDEKNAALWHLKGRIIEKEIDSNPKATNNEEKLKEVIACYEKAIEIDPNMAEALGNLGRIYYNTAVDELQKVNEIKDDKKYKVEKAKLKAIFEKPKPYFERAYKLEPENGSFITALRGIYYNTDDNAKYKEMDEKFKKLSEKK